jgi:transketolase
MRNRFADTFYQLGKNDPRLCVVVADISPAGSIAKFREEFPRRFINTGVSEQIMIGMAAGMAQRGLRPFAYTIATFTLYRPFEMVRDDLCYQNLPVTIVGIGGGVTYSTLGATHHAQEDVAIACSIPNLSVIAPCDPAETEAATRWCATQERGPVYLRLGKAGEPDFTSTLAQGWEFGKLRQLRMGSDVCILSYGPIMKRAIAIADRLEAAGRRTAVYSVHTLKPLDREGLATILRAYSHVVVIEECAPNGGLAMQTRELAWSVDAACRLDAFTLQDAFIHCYGSHDEILDAHGLGAADIFARLDGVGSVPTCWSRPEAEVRHTSASIE